MPKRPEKLISWYPARQCWRKKYKGKTYYLATGGVCKAEHDINGYENALSEWLDIKRGIDGGASVSQLRQLVGAGAGKPGFSDPLPTVGFYDYSKDPELPGEKLAVHSDITLDALVESFLAEYRQLVEMGKRAVSTHRGVKDVLADFQGYAKRHKLDYVNRIESRRLSHYLKCYRDRQLELIAKGEQSPYTAKHRLSVVRKLIEWAYENEYLDQLPRKVNGNYANVPLPDPNPQSFTLEQVRAIWKESNTKTKFSRKSYRTALYVLLGLNCGYRSGDIATLKHSHLIEQEGRLIIVRKREKTGSPQIHRLWPLTAELLRAEITDPREHDLALLDERGKPLVVDTLDKKTSHSDSIGRCFNRLKLKVGLTGAGSGHSVLRDTTAQTLKDNRYPKHVIKQFLGHKERDVVRHYVSETIESRQELFDALDWLEAHYNLKDLRETESGDDTTR
jgi:integrase